MKHPTPLIVLQQATVRRGDNDLLRQVDWKLGPGEHWAVLGANGAGKSTFLALCRGDLPPTSGGRRYGLDGTLQETPIGLRQRLGLVSPALQDKYVAGNWNVTAREIVAAAFQDALFCYRPALESERAAADALLRDLNLEELSGRMLPELSTGQLRAVLLARALVVQPDILFLDECLDGLDARARERMLDVMDRAASRCTLICAAHDPADIPKAVGQALLLQKGRVAVSGSLTEVLEVRSETVAAPAVLALPPVQAVTAPYFFRLRNVSVVFDGRKALDSVDWEMLPGEHWAVLGANGAGKSTLLRTLLGLEDIVLGGSLGWFGVDTLPDLVEVRRNVGFVSPLLQATYAYDLNVRETVWSGFFGSVGLYDAPTLLQQEQAEAVLNFFGLMDLASRRIRTLSHGQLRKTLLARAVAPSPPLLLLDEPLSGLDGRARVDVLSLLEKVAANGTHLVHVTHLSGELPSVINRVLRLEKGRVLALGKRTSAV